MKIVLCLFRTRCNVQAILWIGAVGPGMSVKVDRLGFQRFHGEDMLAACATIVATEWAISTMRSVVVCHQEVGLSHIHRIDVHLSLCEFMMICEVVDKEDAIIVIYVSGLTSKRSIPSWISVVPVSRVSLATPWVSYAYEPVTIDLVYAQHCVHMVLYDATIRRLRV